MNEDVRDADLAAITGLSKHFTIDTLRTYLLNRSRRIGDHLVITGYGRQRNVYQKVAGRAWAHIAAWVVFKGPRDTERDVAHLCGRKDCIEPTHLQQMTRSENLLYDSKRRILRVMCPHERTRNERGKLVGCRVCNAEAQRRWRQRNARSTVGRGASTHCPQDA